MIIIISFKDKNLGLKFVIIYIHQFYLYKFLVPSKTLKLGYDTTLLALTLFKQIK